MMIEYLTEGIERIGRMEEVKQKEKKWQ